MTSLGGFPRVFNCTICSRIKLCNMVVAIQLIGHLVGHLRFAKCKVYILVGRSGEVTSLRRSLITLGLLARTSPLSTSLIKRFVGMRVNLSNYNQSLRLEMNLQTNIQIEINTAFLFHILTHSLFLFLYFPPPFFHPLHLIS